jgi:Secretion system C-terminal sorting domain
MKTNSTLKYSILIIAILFVSLQSKADNNPLYNLNFNSTPVLISGNNLAIGSKYRFDNVGSGTNAVVTIVGATGGASVVILDDNNLTKPEAFSPQIHIPANSTGMVEFKIEFFNGGNSPKNLASVTATAMDIDGSMNLIHEMDAINMGGGTLSYFSASLEINVVQNGTEFFGRNIAGNEYPAVDTSAKKVMFTVTNTNINSFTYKAGGNNMGADGINRQKGIYFKGFDYAALPVKYASFSAVAFDNAVTLKWVSEQEINNRHFEVERSLDGTNFKMIGIALDGFATGSQKNYQFKDNGVELQNKKTAYYRLRQVDNDGKSNYSTTLAVKLQGQAGVIMQTSPNPFTENLNIRFAATTTGVAEIQLISFNGQKVITKQSTISKGYNTLQISGLSKLAPGVYAAQLIMDGVVIGAQKIIKN